ncbi:hypothetical protein LOD99_13771 [Oopsacas minuta]|uniref:Enoyl reductase (ER) domain-containing protein n=1 Tax=Oopsacas minuta TaxID=111878 RepID=A0AAV7KIQ2_9METZ|nr:hypothetical protein LOD99_13771 [Oopsacas minuta]
MDEAELYDVIIIGGGPVGLIISLLLEKYNLSVAVFDMKISFPIIPKALHLSQCTMEILAKIGIYDKILQHSLSKDYPFTMKASIGITKPPFLYFTMDTREEITKDFDSAVYQFQNGRISKAESVFLPQPKLEELLFEQIRNETKVKLFFGTEVIKFYQDGDSIVVQAKSLQHESSPRIYRSKYLIGCDGARSRVRKELGIHLHGEVGLQNFLMMYIESEDVYNKFENNPNSHRFGISTSFQDDRFIMLFHMQHDNRFTFHASGGSSRDISEIVKMDRNELVRRFLGRDIRFEVIDSSEWHANQLIVTHFYKGRIFLAGDSAHAWIPAGGFGLNTGLQDAVNISWKIAAMCQGWSGPYLAPSYQVEQKTYDYNVMRMVSQDIEPFQFSVLPLWMRLLTPFVKIGLLLFPKRIRNIVSRGFKFIGYQVLGQRHIASNICVFEEDHTQRLKPFAHPDSVVIEDLPGCRAPPILLSDGTQIRNARYDTFLILSFVENSNFGNLISQASTRSIPVDYVYVKKETDSVYKKNFYLIRPDSFIAWRSDRIPQGRDIGDILDRAVGWIKPERFNPVYVDWNWKHYPNATKELCIVTPLVISCVWALSLPMVTIPTLILMYCSTLLYRVKYPKTTPRKEIMSRHRAVLCNSPGNPRDVMSLISNRSCQIEADDIIVNVKSAALHNIDYKLCRGYAANLLNFVFSLSYEKRYPLLLGRDFSGEVVVVGSNVKNFVPGDKVYGCRDISSQGTLSEFISVNSNELSLMPESISYDQAASLPYAYLSAVSGLNRIPADFLKDKNVLVCDVGTATGLILTQLLVHRGANVHVWCNGEFNVEFFTAGATTVFLLREKLTGLNFSNFVAVFDINAGVSDFPPAHFTINRGTRLISWTRPGARIIEQYGPVFGTIQSLLTTRSNISSFAKLGVTLSYVSLKVEFKVFDELSQMIEGKIVKPLKGRMFNLSDSPEALSCFEDVDWMGPAIIQISCY